MIRKDFYIIRHGESDCCWLNHDDFIPDLEGWLTPKWHNQAKSLALLLANKWIVFDVLHSSPKQRATETTAVLLWEYEQRAWRPLANNGPIISEEIRAKWYWHWERLPKKEVLTPDNIFAYYNDPDYRTPWGESSRDVYFRSVRFLQELLQGENGSSLWVITHSKIIECLHRYTSHLLNPQIQPFDFPKFQLNNTWVLLLSFSAEDGWVKIDTIHKD
jgi:broad specificity phosphatase PhoE